ncbi:unnamed protein product, partial [Symbiodinium necroappetens]
MGDSLAVELAQQSHHEVLRTVAGCVLRTETVAFRRPFPRGPFFEFLCIDDHIGIQCLSRSAARSGQRLRDTTVFEQASAAYKAVKLVQHPVKCQRNQLQGTLLGASFDGDKGIVSAPSDRILVLMLCTGEIARRGSCTPQLLQTLLGCWIHVLLFRRPAFCVLNNAFADAALQPSTRVIKLSRLTRNELLCIACLGPVLQTDLRASWCPKIFVMDASPTGAALCSCDAPPPVVQELWRFTEQRGYHTRLEGPATAALREKGFESSVEYLASCGTAVNSAKGPLPGELLIKRSGSEVIRDFHITAPAFSFCGLRTPRLRSKRVPAGFRNGDPEIQEHNKIARRIAMLLSVVATNGLFYSISQPGSSVMFGLACFRRLLDLGGQLIRMHACCFGSACRRSSVWLHNKPWMVQSNRCLCFKERKLVVVQGTFSASSAAAFDSLCRPSALAVYGKAPRAGECMSRYVSEHPLPFLRLCAAGSLEASRGVGDVFPLSFTSGLSDRLREDVRKVSRDPTCNFEPRPGHDDPEWINDLAESLQFTEDLRYRFQRPGHINVLEARMFKTFQKLCARRHPSSRTLSLLDSRVTIGAVAKGRSSSRALSRVLQGTLGYTLGGGLYNGSLHVYSAANRADGPSRNRPLDLRSGFTAATADRMKKCFEAFKTWVASELPVSFDRLCLDPASLALALRGYGLYLFSAGYPRYLLVYAITATQDAFPAYRAHMTPAWQIDRKWQHVEPGECRPVISVPILQA